MKRTVVTLWRERERVDSDRENKSHGMFKNRQEVSQFVKELKQTLFEKGHWLIFWALVVLLLAILQVVSMIKSLVGTSSFMHALEWMLRAVVAVWILYWVAYTIAWIAKIYMKCLSLEEQAPHLSRKRILQNEIWMEHAHLSVDTEDTKWDGEKEFSEKLMRLHDYIKKRATTTHTLPLSWFRNPCSRRRFYIWTQASDKLFFYDARYRLAWPVSYLESLSSGQCIPSIFFYKYVLTHPIGLDIYLPSIWITHTLL